MKRLFVVVGDDEAAWLMAPASANAQEVMRPGFVELTCSVILYAGDFRFWRAWFRSGAPRRCVMIDEDAGTEMSGFFVLDGLDHVARSRRRSRRFVSFVAVLRAFGLVRWVPRP